MSWIQSIFQNSGTFDLLQQGHYDEGSNCGWVKRCEDVKNCIGRVCAPVRDAYGGAVYNSCVLACNENEWEHDFNSYACKNPQIAFEQYGIECDGYTPSSGINILGRNFSYLQLASAVILIIIIYIIAKRA